jgi:hypothetical protein
VQLGVNCCGPVFIPVFIHVKARNRENEKMRVRLGTRGGRGVTNPWLGQQSRALLLPTSIK